MKHTPRPAVVGLKELLVWDCCKSGADFGSFSLMDRGGLLQVSGGFGRFV
ncbi:hypothetical protein [Poriferisphaera corsica]|nr:hypothetical protein [Poriferisphaera corsica]